MTDEERTCNSCGTRMDEIRKELHRSLMMEPAKFWIREDVYYACACKPCEQRTDETNILKTPRGPALYPGSFAPVGTVALSGTLSGRWQTGAEQQPR